MNILLTCAGRRNYLVRYFKKALKKSGRVFAADSSATASALQEADEPFIVPPISDPNYVFELREICKRKNIRLIVPLNDLELPILASETDVFSKLGTTILVSSPEVIAVCLDKWKTYCFLKENKLPTAETYITLSDVEAGLAKQEIKFPLIIKPRWGTASLFVQTAWTMEELISIYHLFRQLIPGSIIGQLSMSDLEHAILVQEVLEGNEYGLDILNDLNGNYQTTVARKKISMRAGETDRAISIVDDTLQEIGMRISESIHHIGNIDCDIFVTERGPAVLEINPRFGGGYPFSHEAGANFPAAIIAWVQGKAINPAWLRVSPDLIMSKCEFVMTHKQMESTISYA